MINEFHHKFLNDFKSTLEFLKKNYCMFFDFSNDEMFIENLEILLNILKKCGVKLKGENMKSDEDNMRLGEKWSDDEIKELIEYTLEGMSTTKQATLLKRTPKAVASKRSKLGLELTTWTNQDLRILINLVAEGEDNNTIAKDLNKNPQIVASKITNLGLQSENLKGITQS